MSMSGGSSLTTRHLAPTATEVKELLCGEMERSRLQWSGPNVLRQFAKTGQTCLRVKCSKVYRSDWFTTICIDWSDRCFCEVC